MKVKDKQAAPAQNQQDEGHVIHTTASIVGFYFQDNGTGRQHHEYMAPKRMAEILKERLPKLAPQSEAAQNARAWLAQQGQN